MLYNDSCDWHCHVILYHTSLAFGFTHNNTVPLIHASLGPAGKHREKTSIFITTNESPWRFGGRNCNYGRTRFANQVLLKMAKELAPDLYVIDTFQTTGKGNYAAGRILW